MGGDRYALLKDELGKTLIAMSFSWDTREDALEFFRSYLDLVEQKGEGEWELVETDGGMRLWVGNDIGLHLSLEGDGTLVIIGPDQATVEAALRGISNPTP